MTREKRRKRESSKFRKWMVGLIKTGLSLTSILILLCYSSLRLSLFLLESFHHPGIPYTPQSASFILKNYSLYISTFSAVYLFPLQAFYSKINLPITPFSWIYSCLHCLPLLLQSNLSQSPVTPELIVFLSLLFKHQTLFHIANAFQAPLPNLLIPWIHYHLIHLLNLLNTS